MNMNIRGLVVRILRKAALAAQGKPRVLKPRWHDATEGPLKGACLFLDISDGASREMLNGTYDLVLLQKMHDAGVLKRGKIIWDIGAHIGYDALMFSSFVGSTGQIIAFEPNPHNVKSLKQHFEKNPDLSKNIELKCCAVGDTNGMQTFHFSSVESMSTLGHLEVSGTPSDRISRSIYKGMESTDVETVAIDTLIQNGAAVPDCMKIDVEGAEALVLRGASNLLVTHHPAIMMEVHNIRLMFEVQEILLKSGYELEFFDDPLSPSSSRGFLFATAPSASVDTMRPD